MEGARAVIIGGGVGGTRVAYHPTERGRVTGVVADASVDPRGERMAV